MPLNIERRCKVCLACSEDAVLLKRIYASGAYRVNGEPLSQLWDDYKEVFAYPALTKHVKNHQFVSEKDIKKATLNKIAKQGGNAAALDNLKHGDVRKLIMEKGYKGIKSGKIRLKASDVRAAAKDEMDYELKQKDQAIEVMKMMEKFMSGELEPTGVDPYAANVIDGTAS